MTRDDAKAMHPASINRMWTDAEAFANATKLQGIDVTPLHTASAFHAEADRPWESKTRPRRGRRRDVIATMAAWLFLVLAMFIILSAVFASAARADTGRADWDAFVCNAIGATANSADVVLKIIDDTAETYHMPRTAVADQIDTAVIALCPERRVALAEYVRVYGAVIA